MAEEAMSSSAEAAYLSFFLYAEAAYLSLSFASRSGVDCA
jgi:hypothetical protein